MKQRLVVGINTVIVLALVVASSLLANRWRLEGSNYSAKRKADGVIERNTMVANANRDAEIALTQYTSEGEKERAVQLAAAAADAKTKEAEAETAKVKMNNESTAANAEAVRAVSRVSPNRGFMPASNGPQPNAFETPRQPKQLFKKKY